MTATAAEAWNAGKARSALAPGAQFIKGQWTAAESGAERAIIDPASGEQITKVPDADAADVERASSAARSAFDDGSWSGMHPRDRGRILLRAADLLRQKAAAIAAVESLDVGKPLMFTNLVDIPTAIDLFEYYGALTAGLEGAARAPRIPALAYTRREPIGVVAAITPFNFPLILSASKIAPALAAGNTIVHKPAEETPLSALLLAQVLQEAGLPDGVYNVVTGAAAAGEALLRDPRVDKIAFTGSTQVAKIVARTAAESLKKLTIEAGGKAANIIFADADIPAAIETAIKAFVFNTGQFCMAGTRLLVERPVYEDVLAALAGACPHIPVGDPFAASTVIGPMAGQRHRDKVQGYLDLALNDGVRILGGSSVLPASGCFVAPTILADVRQDSRYVQEEIFGPVLTVQPFDTEDEAVALANGTAFGLAAGLQTGNVARAHRVAARLQAGIVWVNGWAMLDSSMPFGGCKQSGYGRETGPEGLDEYLQTKSVIVSLA
jgi:acyl-CoA reductase-like NAD-dependent aldehyde dehydrogenase